MQYSKYFGSVIKERGRPHINDHQFQRLMNIVFIEGRIIGLEKARLFKNVPLEFKALDLELFKVREKLTELTGNIPPEALFKELVSRDY